MATKKPIVPASKPAAPAKKPTESTILGATPSTSAAPDSAVPDSAVPNSAVPDSAVPDSAVPNSAAAISPSAAPNSAAQRSAVDALQAALDDERLRHLASRSQLERQVTSLQLTLVELRAELAQATARSRELEAQLLQLRAIR